MVSPLGCHVGVGANKGLGYRVHQLGTYAWSQGALNRYCCVNAKTKDAPIQHMNRELACG